MRAGFHFGIEAEFLIADDHSLRPLWQPELKFSVLNELLESISLDGLPSLDGLELEPPHRKLMPYAVEGYHVPAPDLSPIDLLPKGVEIRTPVCDSIEQSVACLKQLFDRLQSALEPAGYRLVSISHHPLEHHFEGPQNKRRHDFWQWAMEVMVTYGPDINVSLPPSLASRVEPADLHAKVNYYGPAMAALSLASPLYRGGLWSIRGEFGKSIRTYRRSIIAPAIELHPEEHGRLEFKLFEATNSLCDYHAFFLLWLAVLLDDGLSGRASNASRVYDLGAAARFGIAADDILPRARSILDRADAVLRRFGFDSAPLEVMHSRVETGRLPADDMIETFERTGSMSEVLRTRTGLLTGHTSRRKAIAS